MKSCNSIVVLVLVAAALIDAFASEKKGTSDPPSLVKRVVAGPPGAYFVYTHSNGFLSDGRLLLSEKTGKWTNLILFDPSTGVATQAGALPNTRLYGGLSRNNLFVTTVNNCVVVMNLLSGVDSSRLLYEAPQPWRMGLPDISPDGKYVYMDFHIYRSSPQCNEIRVLRVDGDNPDGGRVLIRKPWLLNHVQHSTRVPGWIMFAHEGGPVLDRMWAWNSALAPEGVPIFKQEDSDGRALYVGHEVLMPNKLAAISVVFGGSPGRPHGLYEINLADEGGPSSEQLVSEGDRDWHCNISRDGDWAVVDTMGPSDMPGAPSPEWLKDGARSDVMVVNMRTGARRLLSRSSFMIKHPWHPHPHISPDNKWVIYNDANAQRIYALEIDQNALAAFLK